jgi:hypothetical protein
VSRRVGFVALIRLDWAWIQIPNGLLTDVSLSIKEKYTKVKTQFELTKTTGLRYLGRNLSFSWYLVDIFISANILI